MEGDGEDVSGYARPRDGDHVAEGNMFEPGRRPEAKPRVLGVVELTEADIAEHRPAKAGGYVKKLRDSHHMVARLVAFGLNNTEVGARTGHTRHHIGLLRKDPAFNDLVEKYRQKIDLSWVESADTYFELASSNRVKSARLISDKLDDAEPEDFSLRELISVHSDFADRTGYPKRTVALNVNADFASLLDKAIQRSKQARLAGSQPPAIEAPVSTSRAAQEPRPFAAEGGSFLPGAERGAVVEVEASPAAPILRRLG